jgi:hypothetical protein
MSAAAQVLINVATQTNSRRLTCREEFGGYPVFEDVPCRGAHAATAIRTVPWDVRAGGNGDSRGAGVRERASRFRFLIRDRDGKFTTAFDGVLAGNGTRVIKTPVRSPQANSLAERFAETPRRECLDHVLILGEQHLRNVLAEYARHYNRHRPHQSLQQEPPQRQPGNAVDITARIERREVLSGLISEYRRAA